MFAVGEGCQFVQVGREPVGGCGQVDEAVFDDTARRVETHELVHGGNVSCDDMQAVMQQLLDKLRAGGLVFDEHGVGGEVFGLSANGAFEFGVLQATAQHVKQVEFLLFHSPGGADAVVGEFAGLVGRVPALEDEFEGMAAVRCNS